MIVQLLIIAAVFSFMAWLVERLLPGALEELVRSEYEQ